MANPLWEGGPTLESRPDVFPLSTDSVLLADFSAPGPRDRILDLGCGSGVLPVLLLTGRPEAVCTGVEIQPEACLLAERNLRDNGLDARGQVLRGDIRDCRTLIPAGAWDLTVSNPPYFPQGGGYVARGSLGAARSDGCCTLEDLCAAAGWATRWGGRFCVVFRPERLPALILAMNSSGLEPKRLRPVRHSPDKAPSLILLEAVRGGKPGLRWEQDLCLFDSAGEETEEYRRIYHHHRKE